MKYLWDDALNIIDPFVMVVGMVIGWHWVYHGVPNLFGTMGISLTCAPTVTILRASLQLTRKKRGIVSLKMGFETNRGKGDILIIMMRYGHLL